jgi:hypothetical protein
MGRNNAAVGLIYGAYQIAATGESFSKERSKEERWGRKEK